MKPKKLSRNCFLQAMTSQRSCRKYSHQKQPTIQSDNTSAYQTNDTPIRNYSSYSRQQSLSHKDKLYLRTISPKDAYDSNVNILKFKQLPQYTTIDSHNEIQKLDLWDKEHIENIDINELYNNLIKEEDVTNESNNRIINLAHVASMSNKLSMKSDLAQLKIPNGKKSLLFSSTEALKQLRSKLSFNYAPFISSMNIKSKAHLKLFPKIGFDNDDLTQVYQPEMARNMLREKTKLENQHRQDLMVILQNIIINKIEKHKYETILDEFYCCLEKLKMEYTLQIDMLNEQTKGISNEYTQFTKQFSHVTAQKGRRKSCMLIPSKPLDSPTSSRKLSVGMDDKMKAMIYANGQINKLEECKKGYLESFNKLKADYEYQIDKCKKIIKRLSAEEKYLKLIYQKINKQQRIYYLDILKQGIDSRSEGLTWVIKRLYELNASLDYTMFPSFLDHDQDDYLMSISFINSENSQYKLMLKTLQIRQQRIREEKNDKVIEKMNQYIKEDPVTDLIKKTFDISLFPPESIKKFEDIYRKYGAMMKMTLNKQFEDVQMNGVIKEIKDHFKEECKLRNQNKPIDTIRFKSNGLLQFLMSDEKQKECFEELLRIRSQIEELDSLFQFKFKEQQEKFKIKHHKSKDPHAQELSSKVYAALFGAQLPI